MQRLLILLLFVLMACGPANAQPGLSTDSVRAVVFKSGKWGFISNKGQVIIEGQYDFARDFHDGFAVVALKDKKFFIDIRNRNLFNAYYDELSDFSNGYACVTLKDTSSPTQYFSGLTDQAGRLVIPCRYIYSFTYNDSIALVVTRDYEQLYINYQGVPFKSGPGIKKQTLLSRKLSIITNGKKYGIVNEYADTISPLVTSGLNMYLVKGNAALIRLERNGLWGLIDQQGQVIIPFVYDYMSDFSDGLALVKQRGLYGYVNLKGRLVIPPIYSYADEFAEGLAMVSLPGARKPVFINTKGKVQIKETYSFPETRFKRGLLGIFNGRHGFLRKDGSLIFVN